MPTSSGVATFGKPCAKAETDKLVASTSPAINLVIFIGCPLPQSGSHLSADAALTDTNPVQNARRQTKTLPL
jgi:hypothetical protein